jgi:hypothetical protein
MLTLAAAFLRTAKAFMTGSGILSLSPPISKLVKDLIQGGLEMLREFQKEIDILTNTGAYT